MRFFFGQTKKLSSLLEKPAQAYHYRCLKSGSISVFEGTAWLVQPRLVFWSFREIAGHFVDLSVVAPDQPAVYPLHETCRKVEVRSKAMCKGSGNSH
jgi:hypothetical protein